MKKIMLRSFIDYFKSILLRIRREYIYDDFITYDISDGLIVQDKIKQLLLDSSPCMVARIGSVELQSIIDFLSPPTISNLIKFIKGKIPAFGYARSTRYAMNINAGFFPPSPQNLDKFGNLMIDCLKYVDVLGCWRKEESFIEEYLENCIRVPLYTLEPYFFEHTWMPALEGKSVLVIHPFEKTIKKQYAILDKLFKNPEMAPHYELKTIKAVQSIAGNKPDEFDNWFEALDWMKCEINKTEFDIAVVGCGAYGFPLAAYVKQIGKKAIHLGGATQYLFGIISEALYTEEEIVSKFINENWTYPYYTEKPNNSHLVEGGRYW